MDKLLVQLLVFACIVFSEAAARTKTVKEGDSFELACRVPEKPSSVPLKWMVKLPGRAKPVLLSSDCNAHWGRYTEIIGLSLVSCKRRSGIYKLVFKNALVESAGVYSCVLRNQRVDTTVVIDEVDYTVVTEVSPPGRELVEGTHASISCTARGIPPGKKMFWFYNGRNTNGFISDPSRGCRIKWGSLTRMLAITSLTCSREWMKLDISSLSLGSSGHYRCLVGNKNSTISINVKEAELRIISVKKRELKLD